jgi:NTP pyrophosphatase (non-canonical NTP hydrolase)
MCCMLERHLAEVVNPCWNYAGRCKSHQDEVLNAVLGLAGEAGETADQIKKMAFHDEKSVEFHKAKLVHEMGDIMFYFLKLADLMEITLDEIVEANRAKLQSRHPELGKVTERFGEGAIK